MRRDTRSVDVHLDAEIVGGWAQLRVRTIEGDVFPRLVAPVRRLHPHVCRDIEDRAAAEHARPAATDRGGSDASVDGQPPPGRRDGLRCRGGGLPRSDTGPSALSAGGLLRDGGFWRQFSEGVAMAFCGQCGSRLGSAEKFCGECGTPTKPVPSSASATPPPAASPAASPPPQIEPAPTSPPHLLSPIPPASTNRHVGLLVAVAAAVVTLVVGVVLVTRGDDNRTENASITSQPNVTPPVVTTELSTINVETSIAPTTELPTTIADTTLAPTTAAPVTTLAPVPTTPLFPSGWSPAEMPELAYPQLSQADFSGVPSPQIVDYSGPLADGLYRTRFVAQDGITLALDVFRFESCEILGEPSCQEGPYEDTTVNTSDVADARVAIPLDASTRVVISGWNCGEVIGQGNGADLAAMYAAIDADYDQAFGAGLAAGTDPFDLMTAVNANPSTRFGPPPAACYDTYSLVWRFDDAPPVLVQWAFDFETGGWVNPASLLLPSAIAVDGPTTTVYFYSGFFS